MYQSLIYSLSHDYLCSLGSVSSVQSCVKSIHKFTIFHRKLQISQNIILKDKLYPILIMP